MIITTKKTTIALIASASLSAGLALSPMLANADTSPFTSAELSNGYMQLAEAKVGAEEGATQHQKNVTDDKNGAAEDSEMMTEDQATGKSTTEHQKSVTDGKEGEGKCGAMKKSEKEAKCGAKMKKDME